ncbi:MAG: branched-chain amino acid ABC transporter permease [Rhodospirillales bacterium]
MKVLCFALFACAYNLLIGYVGLISFGHAAFFGIAVTSPATPPRCGAFPTEFAILAGTLAGDHPGGVFGWLAIRRQGIYFAMVTLALAQMVYFFCPQVAHPRRGRHPGDPARHAAGDAGSQQPVHPLLLRVLRLRPRLAILLRAINSPFGQVLTVLRENEMRAVSLGYRADPTSSSPSCFQPHSRAGRRADHHRLPARRPE